MSRSLTICEYKGGVITTMVYRNSEMQSLPAIFSSAMNFVARLDICLRLHKPAATGSSSA